MHHRPVGFIRLIRLLTPERRLNGHGVAAIAIHVISSGRLKGAALYLTVLIALVSVGLPPAALYWAVMHVYHHLPDSQEAAPARSPASDGVAHQVPAMDQARKADGYSGNSPNYSHQNAKPPPLQSPSARSGVADQTNGS